MLASTHLAIGGLAAIGLSSALEASGLQSLVVLGGAVLGCMLPDIDHPRSSFGRRVLPISLALSAIFGHRGITHSLLAVVAASILSWVAFNHMNWQQALSVPFVLGLSAGYLSHLAADWFSNSGVPLLWPSRRRFVAPISLSTGSPTERALGIVLYAAFAVLAAERWLDVSFFA